MPLKGEAEAMNQENVIVACPKCGAKNRIPRSRLHDRPVCGRCKTPISSAFHFPEHPIDVTSVTFQREVLSFPGPVVVQFWTPRCGYCRSFAPIFDQTAREFAGRVKFAKVNTDANPAMMTQYGIQGTPTLIFFKNSREVNRIPGAVPKEHFAYQVSALL
jgi:thioredoxin 2